MGKAVFETGCYRLLGAEISGSGSSHDSVSRDALTIQGGRSAGRRPNETPEGAMRPLPKLAGFVPNFGDGVRAQPRPQEQPCPTIARARGGRCRRQWEKLGTKER